MSGQQPAELVRTNVYQRLRADILSCTLRPGQQFQEREMVERFEVSKSPIRDALLKLEEQGLVEVMPRKGYRVRRIDLADVRDMYEMRDMLERECVGRVIDTASEKVLTTLAPFRQAPDDMSLPGWLEYNRAFHSFFAIHCGNARLSRVALEIIEQFDRLTYMSVTSPGETLMRFVDEHARLIDAVIARNRREAVAIARDHVEGSRRRVLDSLESMSIVDTKPERV